VIGQRLFIGGHDGVEAGGWVRRGVVPHGGRKRGGVRWSWRTSSEAGHSRATLQHRTREQGSLTCGASATVPGGAAKFDSISIFKRIQIIFKLFQALTDPKMTFPSSKNLK
jgi:hypothetical protein